MAIFRDSHMGDRHLVARKIAMGGHAKRLGQAEVELGWLCQQAAELIEQEPESFVLRLEIGRAEILPIPFEEVHVIVEIGSIHGVSPRAESGGVCVLRKMRRKEQGPHQTGPFLLKIARGRFCVFCAIKARVIHSR